jgi:hypothetical protein
MGSRNSSVTIVTRLRAKSFGLHIPAWAGEFFILHRLWGPFSVLDNRYRVSFSEIKRRGCEVEHANPSSAKINGWSYTSTLPTCLHGVDSGNFKFNSFRFRHIRIKGIQMSGRMYLFQDQQDPVRKFSAVIEFHYCQMKSIRPTFREYQRSIIR